MQIATVERLFRYPVKSMQGLEVREAHFSLQGLGGDRNYAFVQADSQSPFPWLTARELNELLLYRPEYDEPFEDGRREPPLSVRTPAGKRFGVYSPELKSVLEGRLGRPIYLMRNHRGNFDIAPVSLFDLGLAERIGAEAGVPVDPRRFRANIFVRAEREAFDEATLPGQTLAIGESFRLAITDRDNRCVMITLDPDSAAGEPAVLKTVATRYGNKAGLYGVVLQPGTVHVGDPVRLETLVATAPRS